MALSTEGVKFSDYIDGLSAASESDLSAGNNAILKTSDGMKKLDAGEVGKAGDVEKLQRFGDIDLSSFVSDTGIRFNDGVYMASSYTSSRRLYFPVKKGDLILYKSRCYESQALIALYDADMVYDAENSIAGTNKIVYGRMIVPHDGYIRTTIITSLIEKETCFVSICPYDRIAEIDDNKTISNESKIVEISNSLPKVYAMENKSISIAGVVADSTTRLLTTDFYFNDTNESWTVSVTDDFLIRIANFDADENFVGLREGGLFLSSWEFPMNYGYKFKIQISRVDNTTIVLDDIKNAVSFDGFEINSVRMECADVERVKALENEAEKNNFSLNENLVGLQNEVWSWWRFPNAVHLNRVRDCVYWGYTTTEGYSGIACKNLDDGTISKTHLKINDIDDHNAPAVFIFPTGEIIVAYAGGHYTDKFIHIRKSIVAECIDNFTEDKPLQSVDTTTYSQLIFANGKLYLFYRVSALKWAYRYTDDKGDTWSDEIVFLSASTQYYCKIMNTTIDSLIRIVCYSNPNSGDTDLRMCFLDADNGNILDADASTILGTTEVSSSSITVVVANENGKSQRLLDVAVSAPESPLILYAPFVLSTDSEYEYKIYDNGKKVKICDGGYDFKWLYPCGASFIGTEGNNIISIRELDGVDIVEVYSYSDGNVSLVKELSRLSRVDNIRLCRPFSTTDGKYVIWNKGYFNHSDYTDFNSSAVIASV